MSEQNPNRQARLRWLRNTAVGSLLLMVLLVMLALVAGGVYQIGSIFDPEGPAVRQLVEFLPEFIRDELPSQATVEEPLEASGVIQATEIAVASEFGGRIDRITVEEGDSIVAGDLLIQLDTSLLDAQIEVAKAAVSLAESGVARAQDAVRPGQIAIAEAQLAQALVAREVATQAVSDTLALAENPQDILLQIAVTRAQLNAVEHEVARANALKDAAEIAKNRFEDINAEWGNVDQYKAHIRGGSIDRLPAGLADRLPSLDGGVYHLGDLELHIHDGGYDLYRVVDVNIPFELHLTPNQWWQAWVGVNAAMAQEEGLQATLGQLYSQYAEPMSLEATADEALAALAQAEAHVAIAQAQVEGLRAGATEAQIDALQARVNQAQAALDSLLVQRAKREIRAPADGVIVDIVSHRGEVAAPGATLLTIADLDTVYLTVYVPENQIGQLKMDQEVVVEVDAFPDRTFSGRVTHIADRAEFTPRNVTTIEERVNLVFAVEFRLDNADGALKPGMAAGAIFEKGQ